MKEFFTNEFFIDLICAILTVIVPIIAKYIVKYSKSKTSNIYINTAIKAVTDAVISINQTFVDGMKKNGTFDKEAQDIAKEKAYNATLSLLSSEVKTYLESHTDMKEYINTLIETKVKEVKE